MIDFEEAKTIRVKVHTIRMADVDDPDVYVAQPIYDWQQTEEGKWIMEHSSPIPSYGSYFDHSTYGYTYDIIAYLKPIDYTFWSLKYK